MSWQDISRLMNSIIGKVILAFSAASVITPLHSVLQRIGVEDHFVSDKTLACATFIMTYLAYTLTCPREIQQSSNPDEYCNSIFSKLEKSQQTTYLNLLQKEKVIGNGTLDDLTATTVGFAFYNHLSGRHPFIRYFITVLILISFIVWTYRDFALVIDRIYQIAK
jgi:predicted PurR-regulated permease PerM